MGYRVSMRAIDPGPTGGPSAASASMRRGNPHFGGGGEMPALDQLLTSYSTSFANPSGSKRGMPGLQRSISAAAVGGSPVKVPMSMQKATSLPKLVVEERTPRSPVHEEPRLPQAFDSKSNAQQQRALVELLGNPELKKFAKDIFKRADTHKKGKLSFEDMQKCLIKLHDDLGIDLFDEKQAVRMFKKYDVRSDQILDFEEFFDLLLAVLRQEAFSRRDVVTREFFVNQNKGKVWNEWEKVKQLGKGSFGTAYLAKNHHGEERVVKAVKKSRIKMPVEDVEREIMVMRQVDHPHIVRLFEWYEDKSRIYLIMEALKGGTLKDAVLEFQKQRKGLKEEWTRDVTRQMMSALAYCHSLRLIHKDIKDENIMLLKKEGKDTKPFAVLIDLGIAEMFGLSDPHGRECGGTPVTMAPEVWQNSFGPKCDTWSLGCVLFQMLSGHFPFMATSMNAQAWIRLHRRGPDWTLIKTSAASKKMCQAMLTFKEELRPTMTECLQHDWFIAAKKDMYMVTPQQMLGLQAFAKEGRVKRTLLLEIATRLPIDRATEIVALFEGIDKNGDGNLSKKELADFLSESGVTDTSIADACFKSLDVDGNGELSFSEFAAGVLQLFKDVLEERLDSLIEDYDNDHDGLIDKKQIEGLMENVASAIGDESAKALVKDVMKGADGRQTPDQLKLGDLKARLMRSDSSPGSSGK